ncbi:MAG: gamma-glutamylcyclotransferase family protein [Burkholderiaceae bacterium]
MPHNVFTYGSLMFPAVWARIVHAPCRSCGVMLGDYARYAVAGEAYPGMIAQAGGVIEGVLYLDVGRQDIARLDAFEGSEYRRIAVQVRLADGRQLAAQAYLFTAAHRLAGTAWNADAFDIRRFLAAHCPYP